MEAWVYIIGNINDALLSLIISVLFARRLLSLSFQLEVTKISNNLQIKSGDDKTRSRTRSRSGSKTTTAVLDKGTWNVLKKSTLLTFIALITTQITMILCIIFGEEYIWLGLDTIINSYCIILMFSVHGNLYKYQCQKTRLENCITIKCLACYACMDCSVKCNCDNGEYDGEKRGIEFAAENRLPSTSQDPTKSEITISDENGEQKIVIK